MKMLSQSILVVLTGSLTLLGGCGGSSSDNNSPSETSALGSGSLRVKSPVIETQAVVTADNTTALALAAARGIKKVVLDDLNQQKVPFSQSASGLDLTYCESGTAKILPSADNSILSQVLSFNSCLISGSTINGNALLTSSADSEKLTFYFFDMTVADASGQAYSLAGSEIVCSGLSGAVPSCTYGADWTEGGEAYRMEEATLIGNMATGYLVSVKVYDTKNGFIDVKTNAFVTFNCSNQNPNSGGATFTGAQNTSGTVNFDSCSSLTVMVNGVATTVNWADL